jgi:hypothetical protein
MTDPMSLTHSEAHAWHGCIGERGSAGQGRPALTGHPGATRQLNPALQHDHYVVAGAARPARLALTCQSRAAAASS